MVLSAGTAEFPVFVTMFPLLSATSAHVAGFPGWECSESTVPLELRGPVVLSLVDNLSDRCFVISW